MNSKHAHSSQRSLSQCIPRIANGGAVNHQAITNPEKRAKQQYLDDQVGFIIRTRDNNKPDAYGAVSTTYAPLSWSAVAKAYNEKYGVSITQAAMEKRARQHRAAWLANHPSYPTQIIYAEKPEALAVSAPAVGARKTADGDMPRVSENDASSHERIAGWVPPDDVRNASDIRNYIAHAVSMGDTGTVSIEVLDAHDEALLGSVTINRQVLLRNSSILGRLHSDEDQMHVHLYGVLEKIVQCYVLCASSEDLPQSSEHEVCDGVSLIQLYCLAAQLEDDHVRGLVLDRWRLLLDQNEGVEIALEELNMLFECTRCGDPARDFWVSAICAAGLAEGLLATDACSPVLTDCIRSLAAEESAGYMGDLECWY